MIIQMSEKTPLSTAYLAMAMRPLLLVALVLTGHHQGIIEGQTTLGGDDGEDCCPSLMVNVKGSDLSLNGDYKLKTNRGSKPEEICINGCIYTKEGSSSSVEYCFKLDRGASADVQCQA